MSRIPRANPDELAPDVAEQLPPRRPVAPSR